MIREETMYNHSLLFFGGGMKYYYERPESWILTKGYVSDFNHPLYNKATVYSRQGVGVAIVQQRFNTTTKVTWWGPIDPWLVDEIAYSENFNDWFEKNADGKDENGLYPTFTIREVMWAMKMKPLKREIFENIHWR